MTGQKTPVASFQAEAVQAAIWKNFFDVKGKKTEILKVSVQKRYKSDGD